MYMDSNAPHAAAREIPFLGQASLIQNIEAATVRAIVRGTLPVDAVKDGGIHTAAGTAGTIPMGAADIAAGIMTHKDEPPALAEWANFLVVIADRLRFDAAESAWCEKLMASVWELSFGTPLKDSVFGFAQTLHARAA
jgi:hypothetical protein